MQFELRPHHDHAASRVVDALAQEVLAEPAALALDHIGQRLERPLVRPRHRLAPTPIVQQGVHCLLQHAFLVADDNLRRFQLEQTLQAVVPVDDASVQVVQIRGREAAAVQRHQRTQLRRQHRQDFHHHPVRFDARLLEAFQHLQPFCDLLDLGFGVGAVQFPP